MNIIDFLGSIDVYTADLSYILVFTLFIYLLNSIFLSKSLFLFGIRPRSFLGLSGILCAPLLHGSLSHLLSNTFPFFCLMQLMIFINGWEGACILAIEITLLSGLLIWMLGRRANHIGASAMISGLFGWCVSWSFLYPSIVSFAILATILFYFGTIFIGVLPTNDDTSWEGHLFGLISGILLVYYEPNIPWLSDIATILYFMIVSYGAILLQKILS